MEYNLELQLLLAILDMFRSNFSNTALDAIEYIWVPNMHVNTLYICELFDV